MANRLFQDYLLQKAAAASFFNYPLQPPWDQVCEEVLSNYRHREFLQELGRQNETNPDVSVREQINLLAQPNTVLIVTGQQMGLFVSPLYTIYKILTTILLSRKLSGQFKKYHFLPVFWLEGEDHDFAEVNHAQLFDKTGSIIKIEHPNQAEYHRFSMSKRLLFQEITDLLHRLRNDLQETEFSVPLFERLEKIYMPERSWSEAFAGHLQMLFEGSGLLLFNPSTLRVKEYSEEFFIQFIRENNLITEALMKQSQAILSMGYENQVPVDPQKSYLFLSPDGHGRNHLLRQSSTTFCFKDTDKSYDYQELTEQIHSHPGWCSSSVLSRPIWQSWMLPVVAYVGGPAEICYWAQLKGAFERMHVVMPVVYPRMRITLIEPKIQRLLDKFGLSYESVNPDAGAFIQEFFKNHQSPGLQEEFQQLNGYLNERAKVLKNQVMTIDPTLNNLVIKTFEHVSTSIQKLQTRIFKEIEEKEQTITKQLKTLHQYLYPDGQLQERYISSLYYQNKFGPQWIGQLVQQCKLDEHNHQVIAL